MNLLRTSARILKGQAPQSLPTLEALQYADLRQQSLDATAAARAEASQIVEAARAEADAIRAQAAAEGYAAGCAEARDSLEEEIEHRSAQRSHESAQALLAPLLQSVADLLQRLSRDRDEWIARWEVHAHHLARQLAERILRTRLSTEPQLAEGMLREALSLAAGLPVISLRIHPADQPLIESASPSAAGSATCRIVIDPSITRGGCQVELSGGAIDARIETQLDRLLEELTGE